MAKKITLKSCDGKEFVVDEMVAMKFQTVRNMIRDGYEESGIPLPNVTSNILSKVIEYCQMHVDAAATDQELNQWDQDFVKLDLATLFGLILAANNLGIRELLDLTCRNVAGMIGGNNDPDKIIQMIAKMGLE